MTTQLHVPPPPLSEHVKLIWHSESYVQPHPQERLLPTGRMTLAIFLDGDDRLDSGISFRAFSGVSPTAYLRDRTSRNHVAVHD